MREIDRNCCNGCNFQTNFILNLYSKFQYCIQYILQEKTNMNEQQKMGLRPKRKPKYRPSDEQDLDHPSHSRPNYAKMTTPTHTQQYVSPSVLLNQNAKLLVRFINKANKEYRECCLRKQMEQKQTMKKETVTNQRVNVQSSEINKKPTSTNKNPKTQPPKKNKQLYNFKGLHQNSDLLKNINPEQMIKNIKGIDNLLNNKGIYSVPLSNQLSQLQNLYPKLKDMSYQSLTQPPNPDLFKFSQQPQNQRPSKPLLQQPPKPTVQKKHSVQEDKLFKRSAYHIAIAYHIYLKKLRDKGITSGDQIDPTYPARVMRQRSGMPN